MGIEVTPAPIKPIRYDSHNDTFDKKTASFMSRKKLYDNVNYHTFPYGIKPQTCTQSRMPHLMGIYNYSISKKGWREGGK